MLFKGAIDEAKKQKEKKRGRKKKQEKKKGEEGEGGCKNIFHLFDCHLQNQIN